MLINFLILEFSLEFHKFVFCINNAWFEFSWICLHFPGRIRRDTNYNLCVCVFRATCVHLNYSHKLFDTTLTHTHTYHILFAIPESLSPFPFINCLIIWSYKLEILKIVFFLTLQGTGEVQELNMQ